MRSEFFESERGRRPGKGKPDDEEFRLNIEPIRPRARSDVLDGEGEDGRVEGAEAGGVTGGGVPGVPGVDGTAGVAAVAMISKVWI